MAPRVLWKVEGDFVKMSITTDTTAQKRPEILAWDSEFWNMRIARAYGIDGLSEWAVENTVGLVCLLIDADRPDEAQKAEEAGFRLTDVRVTLARETSQEEPFSVRMPTEIETNQMVAIARYAHRITRFYADPTLDDDRCDDLYENWMRQSLNGWADAVFVAGETEGYVTVHLDGSSSSIGLIAVADEARRKGLGEKLVRGAVAYAATRGATEMTVVTQGRNIAAQRLFQACGFRTTNTSLWYHRRYDVEGGQNPGSRG